MADQCSFCQQGIGAEFKTEYFMFNGKLYCSIRCYYDEDQRNKETSNDFKAKGRPQANKGNKRPKKVLAKGSKQKKRSRLGKILIKGLKEAIRHNKGKIKLRETKRVSNGTKPKNL